MGQITGFISRISPAGTNGLLWWDVEVRSSGAPDPPDAGHWMGRKVRVSEMLDGVEVGDGRVVAPATIEAIGALRDCRDALAYHSHDATFGAKDRAALARVRELLERIGAG